MKKKNQPTLSASFILFLSAALILLLLPHPVPADNGRFMIFKVEVDPALESGKMSDSVKDFYIHGGSNDGITESSILEVYREKNIRNPETGQDSAVSIPVGKLQVVKLYEDITVARILSLTEAEDTPVLKYRMVMIGDYAIPAKKHEISQEKESVPPVPEKTEREIPEQHISEVPGIVLPAEILFRFNEWKLKPEAVQILAEVHNTFQELTDRNILIEGHTCSLGSSAYNLELSRKRAQSVADHLTTSMGIPAERIHVKYYGEESPIASNATKEGREMNRRVVIRFPQASTVD